MTTPRHSLVIVAVFTILLGESARAHPWAYHWDNDLLTGSDKGYTIGMRPSCLNTAAENDPGCRFCRDSR